MDRVYNFSAGPAVLPEEVLQEAADEMLNYRGCGMSVMEMSHRGKIFDGIIKEAEADLRDLLQIPDNYKVLFLQGGAWTQFAAVPMNLMRNHSAAYIITGQWAKKAWQEARKYGDAVAVASSEDKTFSYIPDCSDLDIPEEADYVYICENNTIYGTKFKELPNTKGHDLVADVSSCFLSEPVDITKYAVMYGGVQKNVGKTGRCFVEFRMVGIILGDADRHRSLGFDIVGTVGMNADEGVCIVFVCDSSALGAADRIEGIMVGHLDLISALLKFSACLLGHIHSQFVFVQTARRTEGTYGIFFLHFGGAGADRLCEAGDLGGVSGIKDNDKSLAHGREGFFL